MEDLLLLVVLVALVALAVVVLLMIIMVLLDTALQILVAVVAPMLEQIQVPIQAMAVVALSLLDMYYRRENNIRWHILQK